MTGRGADAKRGALGRRQFLRIGVGALTVAGLAMFPGAAAADPGVSAALSALELGEPPQPRLAPDFTVPALIGGSIAIKDLRGRPVLIHFWTTWCQPCRWELPLLEKLYREHKAEGFVMLGISIDPSRELVGKYIAEKDYTFPVGLDPEREVGDRYRVMGVPGTYIVDAKGYLRGKGFGPREWDTQPAHALVRALLAGPR